MSSGNLDLAKLTVVFNSSWDEFTVLFASGKYDEASSIAFFFEDPESAVKLSCKEIDPSLVNSDEKEYTPEYLLGTSRNDNAEGFAGAHPLAIRKKQVDQTINLVEEQRMRFEIVELPVLIYLRELLTQGGSANLDQLYPGQQQNVLLKYSKPGGILDLYRKKIERIIGKNPGKPIGKEQLEELLQDLDLCSLLANHLEAIQAEIKRELSFLYKIQSDIKEMWLLSLRLSQKGFLELSQLVLIGSLLEIRTTTNNSDLVTGMLHLYSPGRDNGKIGFFQQMLVDYCEVYLEKAIQSSPLFREKFKEFNQTAKYMR